MKNSQKFSGPEGLCAELTVRLADEHSGYTSLERTPGAKKLREAQGELLEIIKVIGQSDNIDAMFSAEKTVFKNERRLDGKTLSRKKQRR